MWRYDACVLDMLIAPRKIRAFTDGETLDRFRRDELMQHGVMRLIEILGEAARHVSDHFKANHPEIPWRQIIGTRNRMVHEYFRVIPAKVWEVVEQRSRRSSLSWTGLCLQLQTIRPLQRNPPAFRLEDVALGRPVAAA
jgi:uncharacterized protein with HEPN domain